MYRLLLILTITLLASACSGDVAPDLTPAPTEPPLIGGVNIVSPQLGSVIHAEVLSASGTIDGVEAFRLELETVDGEILFDGIINSQGDAWRAEVILDYVGEPVEAVLRAKSKDRRVSLQYDELSLLIAPMTLRDEGVFGIVLSPSEDQQVGGDAIQISGTASGISDSRLSIVLKHDEGLIDKQIIRLDNPYQVDERVWSADLLTNGYMGRATLEVSYTNPETESEQILDTISILIGSVAG